MSSSGAKKHLTARVVKQGEVASAFTACPDKIIAAAEANCISLSSIYGFDFYRFEMVCLALNFGL